MNSNLKDILSNLNNEIDQEKLLDYLNKKLSATDAHDLEKQMIDDQFMNDAVDGLEEFSDKKDLSLYVKQLNKNLTLQLEKKQNRKAKRGIKNQPLFYFTIIVLLLLIIIGYIMIRKYIDKKQQQTIVPSSQIYTTPKFKDY